MFLVSETQLILVSCSAAFFGILFYVIFERVLIQIYERMQQRKLEKQAVEIFDGLVHHKTKKSLKE